MRNKFRRKLDRRNFLILLMSLAVIFCAGVMQLLQERGIPAWEKLFDVCAVSDFSSSAEDYPMSVHVLDVGKADAIFVTCEGKNILIDAGETDIHKAAYEYLRRRNVKELDFLVLTHQHSDHVGCMAHIVDRLNVKSVTMPHLKDDMVPTLKSYERLLLALDRKNMKIKKPEPGSSFDIGSLKVDILGPVKQYDDMNSNSIVLKLTYKNRSFLFTGDAGKESERDMIAMGYNLKADVLKVGHHGSKTATSQAFLNRVQPSYAVISVGEDRNKLPKKEIIDRLKKNNIKTYRTDLDGTVVLATDGDNIKIFCEKEKKLNNALVA